MNCFNIIKDICELLYYLVGIAGLLTIYYTVKSNKSLKEEKEEMQREKITSFIINDYKEFKEWKKIQEGQRKIISVGNINLYIKEKKLQQEQIDRFSAVLQNDDEEKMKEYIFSLNEISKIYKKLRTSNQNNEMDECILDMFQTCIYECDKLNVFKYFKDLTDLFVQINKEYANG